MYPAKAILTLGLSILIVSHNQKPKPMAFLIYNRFEEPEILKGRIKVIIQTRSETHLEDELCPIDTTFFDRTGLPVETRLGTGDRVCLIAKYTKQYHDGWMLQNSDGDKGQDWIFIKYGKSGEIIEFARGDDSTYYKYNNGHLIMSYRSNLDTNMYKNIYSYDTENNVILVEHHYYLRKSKRAVLGREYRKILSVDKNDNWTKRMVYFKNAKGIITTADTTTRKIIYYN